MNRREFGAVEILAIALTVSVWVLSIPFVPISESRKADFRVINAEVITIEEGATLNYPDGTQRLACIYLVSTFIQNLETDSMTLNLNITRPKLTHPDFLFFVNETDELRPLQIRAVGLIVSSGTYSEFQEECTGLLAPSVLLALLELSTPTTIHETRLESISQLTVFVPLALVTSVALGIVIIRRLN